jgi:hypothetical protein
MCTAQPVRLTAAWPARCVSDLAELREAIGSFANERDWDQFHDPKSLILVLVGEVGNSPNSSIATRR